MMIQKRDIPLITHAQATEIDRELKERYDGGAVFPTESSSIYGAYRENGKLHIIHHYLYDADGYPHQSMSNLGLYLDHNKDIYHITLEKSDAQYSFSNFIQNRLGIMTTQQKLARVSMTHIYVRDVFTQLDNGTSVKPHS